MTDTDVIFFGGVLERYTNYTVRLVEMNGIDQITDLLGGRCP